MSKLLDKNSCSGCMACRNACPIGCISVRKDSNGFYMPYIDSQKCLNCGACERACKMANGVGMNAPMYGIAFAIHDTQALSRSSSGGAFTAIARMVLDEGGVIYGAAYDKNFEVRHIRVDDTESLAELNGSKYVQSDLQNCFESVKEDLKCGRSVLFSGTPCQVAGLTACVPKALREKLLTVDFICHGVPSPKAWAVYVGYLSDNVCGSVCAVNMRDHRISHENFGLSVIGNRSEFFQSCVENPYLAAFINNLLLRESCYRCKHKTVKCHSDITLGDLWGEKELLPTSRYTGRHSLVIANSAKGAAYIDRLTDYGATDKVSLRKALTINSSRFYPSIKPCGTNISNVVDGLRRGVYESKPTDNESLQSRLKRKITVICKCFFTGDGKK